MTYDTSVGEEGSDARLGLPPLPSLPSVPSHVVMSDDAALLPQVRPFLLANNFVEQKRFFNAHFAVDRGLQVM
jgi:hypothetical protein